MISQVLTVYNLQQTQLDLLYNYIQYLLEVIYYLSLLLIISLMV